MPEIDNANIERKENGHDQTETPVFNINTIYVKDLSFESPNVPQVLNAEWQPKIDFDLQLNTKILDEAEGVYEVELHITVTAKLKEELVVFLIDVRQAGIFVVHRFEADVASHILSVTCPTAIFPYARETIANLVQRGGFPQLVLPPINFEAMYLNHLESRQNSGDAIQEPIQ